MNNGKIRIRRILVQDTNDPGVIVQRLGNDQAFIDGAMTLSPSDYTTMGYHILEIQYPNGCRECGTGSMAWIRYDLRERKVL